MTLLVSASEVEHTVFAGAELEPPRYSGLDICIFRGDMRIPAQHEPCGSLISGKSSYTAQSSLYIPSELSAET